MIIKIEENIKSFSAWRDMVKANAEKLKDLVQPLFLLVYQKKMLQNLQ